MLNPLFIAKRKYLASAALILLQAVCTDLYAAESTTPVSDLYSDIDMRVRLAVKPDAQSCAASTCEENRAFDERVAAIGRYLSKAAEILYPQQVATIQRMTFSVIDKKDLGTASNNKGNIIIFRGVQGLQLSDDALGFIIAREMGHVLDGHHVTNTSTKLLISAVASIIFPAAAIISASSTAAQASTATSLVSSAASTATSMLGGEIAMAKMKPSQLQSADEIARNIMAKAEWDMRSANSVLIQDNAPVTPWQQDLEQSRLQLEQEIASEEAAIEPLTDMDQLADHQEPSAVPTHTKPSGKTAAASSE